MSFIKMTKTHKYIESNIGWYILNLDLSPKENEIKHN